jgi:AcrR family transcriptional regulator
MSTVISRRERKKQETRSRIFKAAIRLFRERGFEATTVDDITEKADVAKGTFFNYFPRKDAVLAYLSEQRLDEVETNVGVNLASRLTSREKLLQIYTNAASAYEEDRELSRYVIVELMARAFGPSEESSRRWHDLIASVIRQGHESGELRTDVDVTRAESLLSSVYMATIYLWVSCMEHDFALRDEIRARLGLVLDGMATRKGGAS